MIPIVAALNASDFGSNTKTALHVLASGYISGDGIIQIGRFRPSRAPDARRFAAP